MKETIKIENMLVVVDYDSEPDELPSMYSAGHPGGLCVNKVTFKDGTDALPFVMAIDEETEEQALAWVERLLDHKLTMQAEDQQGERMRSGRRAW
jgi:hypothetical protein